MMEEQGGLNWIEYNQDKHSTQLTEGSYFCRLEYPDGRLRYTVKQFTIFGVQYKRGYFSTNGKKYKITHFAKFNTLEDIKVI